MHVYTTENVQLLHRLTSYLFDVIFLRDKNNTQEQKQTNNPQIVRCIAIASFLSFSSLSFTPSPPIYIPNLEDKKNDSVILYRMFMDKRGFICPLLHFVIAFSWLWFQLFISFRFITMNNDDWAIKEIKNKTKQK